MRQMVMAALLGVLIWTVLYGAATVFSPGDTLPATWLNKVFGTSGHRHTGENADGFAPKIDGPDEIARGPAAAKENGTAWIIHGFREADGGYMPARAREAVGTTYAQLAGSPGGVPDAIYLRSATTTPQVCAYCLFVNESATPCQITAKVDFFGDGGAYFLDAAIVLGPSTVEIDAGYWQATGSVANPYPDDAGTTTGGVLRWFALYASTAPADGGIWDGTGETTSCDVRLYTCSIYECDTDAGTGP